MPQQGIKALVLAAGPGTRLLPHTRQVPKPLFPVAGRPVIDIIIWRLISQGISAIGVNTHHLHEQVQAFISSRNYPVPVVTRYEPEMLGTGGAIGNFADFLGYSRPFVVINSDILTDIDIREAAEQHMARSPAATLIVHDCPEFNKVRIDAKGLVREFSGAGEENERCLAFTGIQVIDPVIYDYIPAGPHVSSIDVYRSMIAGGLAVIAHESTGHFWHDMGTPGRYFKAVAESMAPGAFKKAFNRKPVNPVAWRRLSGDGSDRRWFRVSDNDRSLIVADHGIRTEPGLSEFDSFVLIGRHLEKIGAPVPEIYCHDRFSGIAFLRDLGDTLLQAKAGKTSGGQEVEDLYRLIIEKAVDMNIRGARGFEPGWCWQESFFSRKTVVEKEGMYFVRSFLEGFLGMKIKETESLHREFERIADVIEDCGFTGFMHRDLQSRNIMIKDNGCFFIDFQGGRRGPVQYDLASLITDPYADLARELRQRLLIHAIERLEAKTGALDRAKFLRGYLYCAISRNLQALGAYGYLTVEKQKKDFARYMAPALKNLRSLVASTRDPTLPELGRIADRAGNLLGT